MGSPFPGMDPYLEHPVFWTDFHSRFLNCWCEALAEVLPDDYEASLAERVYVAEQDPDARKLIYPEGPRESFIEILHRPERSLIAVLELLSPANKEQPGRQEYVAKRNALLHQSIHLVELDLLNGGRRLPMQRPLPSGDCFYFVSRADQRPDCQVYAWSLRAPFPRLPVPLRAPDPDIHFELGQAFTTAYERGRFARRLEYGKPCPRTASKEDRAWAEEIAASFDIM